MSSTWGGGGGGIYHAHKPQDGVAFQDHPLALYAPFQPESCPRDVVVRPLISNRK